MDQKVRGLLAYLFGWLGGLIILLSFKDNTKLTNQHAAQSCVFYVVYLIICIGLWVINFIISLLMSIADNGAIAIICMIISLLIWLVCMVLSVAGIAFKIIGMIKEYKEKEFNVPVVSNLAQKIFKSKLA